MLVGKNLIKKLVGSLVGVLAFAVPSLSADVWPLRFDGVSTDPKVQQDFWDSLMQFKMYGAEGIEFVEGGNIHITDTLGRFGTSRGDFVIIGDNNSIGGPILIGGDIRINSGGSDVFMTGPTRVSKSIIVKDNQLNSVGQNFFHGPTCVNGSVSSAFSDGVAPQNQFFGANYASCPDSVPNFMDGLKVPSSPDAVPAGKPVLPDIDESGEVFNIDIPAETPGDSGMYDVYINSITLSNQGALAIRMPESGRLTRIFVQKLSIGSQSTIQVYYKNKAGGYTAVDNDVYAGDLLFYVNSDLNLTARDNGKTIQGTFISSGTISVKQQLTLAGQLLAKNLKIAANFDGSKFFFKSFDSKSFKDPETSVLDTLYESALWDGVKQNIDVRLNGKPTNQVTFHYCFIFDGNADDDASVNNFNASEADVYASEAPICGKGQPGSGRFVANTDTLAEPITLKVKDDILLENDEYFWIKIYDVSGARVSKDSLVKEMNYKILIVDDDKTPVCHDTTITMLEDDTVFLAGEGFNYIAAYAHDGETPLDMYYQVPILETPAYKLYIGEEAVKPEAELYRPIPNYILTSTRYTPGKNGNNSTVTGSHFDSLTFAIEVNAANGRKGTYSDPCKLYIDVTPVNDAPVLNDTTITIRENTPVDSIILQLVATDVENDNLVYSIDSGDVALFNLKGFEKDSLYVKAPLNYEKQKEHVLKVVVTDDGEGNLKDTAYVTIKLIDENEEPKFDKSSYEFTVREHAPYDSIFGTIHAIDPDSIAVDGSFNKIRYTYKLVSPVKEDSAFWLSDIAGTFAVKNSDSLNYEKIDKYVLWAYATDAKGLYDSAKVTVTVEDINEDPAFEQDKLYYQKEFVSIPEVTTNQEFLTFNFSDPDVKSILTKSGYHKLQLKLYDCTPKACGLGNENEVDANVASMFSVKMNADSTSGVLSLIGASKLNYEVDSTYNMLVELRDNVGYVPSLVDTIVIRVRITNVNETPAFDSTKYTFKVEENKVGVYLGSVKATDKDLFDKLTYTFAEGKTELNSMFVIRETSAGADIYLADEVSLDYETDSVYTFKVYVKDNGVDAEGGILSDSTSVTVKVIDVNETPWGATITCQIPENSAKNDTLTFDVDTNPGKCQMKGEDPDKYNKNFNQLSYSWADASERGTDIFAIHPTSGKVYLTKDSSLNYEKHRDSTEYQLTVKIKDNGGLDSTALVIINIKDVNEAPVLRDTTVTIPEDYSTTKNVVALKAVDPENDKLTYKIISFTPDKEHFRVVKSTDYVSVLRVLKKGILDYETDSLYVLKIEVSDGELTSTATVTIKITNVNEPPEFVYEEPFKIDENNEENAFVGQLVAKDVDSKNLLYSLVHDESGLFAVDFTGRITVPQAKVLNYESIPYEDQPLTYVLTVAVEDDGGLRDEIDIEVLVRDVNEKPELCDTLKFSVKEHQKSGTTVGMIKAADFRKDNSTNVVDEDFDESFVFSLKEGFGKFSIGQSSGIITTTAELNYESPDSVYTLEVIVKDKGGKEGFLADTAKVEVRVVDINETPTISGRKFTIDETTVYPDTVGTHKGSDKDLSTTKNGSLAYSLADTTVGGKVTNATKYFTINQDGLISVVKGATFDYETKDTVYYVKVIVKDAGNPQLMAYAVDTICIRNVPESPNFDVKYPKFTVDENSPEGTFVGELKANDNDLNETLIYTMDDPSGKFYISYENNVATIRVEDKANLDYESGETEFIVTVTVTDKTGLSDEAYVTISVNDVNEKPTLEEQTFTLYENMGDKYKFEKTVVSGDLDSAAAFKKNHYEVLSGDTAWFSMNSKGEIVAKHDMDYESWLDSGRTTADGAIRFVLETKVVDDKVDTLFVVKNMYIDLLNVNEAPEVTTDSLTVPENAPADTTFGMLDATDPDGPTTFSFGLARASSEFYVDVDGSVHVKKGAKLDYETTTHQYTIYVNVKDAEGMASATKPVVITVIDVNEPPVLNDTILYVREDASVDTIFGKVVGSDPDIYNEEFRQLSYKMISVKDSFDFLADGSAKLLRHLDYEADSMFVRKVVVSDGKFADTANVTIKVINVVESTYVEIIKVNDPDSTWYTPDTIYTNTPDKTIDWMEEDKKYSFDTTLVDGPNIISRCYLDRTKDLPGCDTVVIFYSNATPIVKVYAEKEKVSADNVYTIVEETAKGDSNIYVNDIEKEITVSVVDTAAGINKKFTINLELDTVSVSEKTLKLVNGIAAEKTTIRDPSEIEIRKIREGDKIVSTYKDSVTVNGEKIPVKVSYNTDSKGVEAKTAVINENGKIDSIVVITVSYATKVNGMDMVVSYQADAYTGEILNTTAGGKLTKAEPEKSVAAAEDAIGKFTVSYDYEEKRNTVNVRYVIDEKGNIVKNDDGDIGYSVSYTYVNKFGNAATKSVYIVLDQTGPKVEILDPVKSSKIEVVNTSFINVKWTVNGEEQDTLTTQGLEKGLNAIVRFYRDKAGNESSDTVFIIMKNSKNIDIAVEQPVTEITREKVDEYYAKNPPKEGQTYSVSIMNPSTGKEVETLVGSKKKTTEGSGEEPYPGVDAETHLGPTLSLDIKLPVVKQGGSVETDNGASVSSGLISGLATLDDIVNADGRVPLDGVDANDGEKPTVAEYVREYCVDGFKIGSDMSQTNLYDSKVVVKIWVYTTLGDFVNYYNFTQELNDPSYTNEAGVLKLFFEMKPDKDGDVRTDEGRLIGTGSYVYKVEVKLRSELKCSLPPIGDAASPKKGDVVRYEEQLLKSFGYKRPSQK